jgi:DNA repair protein RecN (Recombination protein N)
VLNVAQDLSTFTAKQIPAEVEFLKKATIIFDEIDTGIGGAVADSVGEKLKYLGQACQVIVITHQPQVACKADNHILVTKRQLSDVTDLEVKILSFSERQQELARMLSGKTITESSLKAALDLLS